MFRWQFLRSRREALKRTVTDVASACGVSVWTVQRWENGSHAPLLTNYPALLTHYVCSESDLFPTDVTR